MPGQSSFDLFYFLIFFLGVCGGGGGKCGVLSLILTREYNSNLRKTTPQNFDYLFQCCGYCFLIFSRILIFFFITFLCEQAIMYILCFRLRSLMDIPRLKLQLLNMPMEAIWKHKLSPLEVRNILQVMVFTVTLL